MAVFVTLHLGSSQRKPNLNYSVGVTTVALSKYRRILVSTCAVVGYARTAGVFDGLYAVPRVCHEGCG